MHIDSGRGLPRENKNHKKNSAEANSNFLPAKIVNSSPFMLIVICRFLLDKLINFERTTRLNPKLTVHPPPLDQSPKPPVNARILKSRERKTNPRANPPNPRANPPKTVSSAKSQRKPVSTASDMPKELKKIRHPSGASHVSTRKLVMSESSSSDESGSEEETKEKKKTAGIKLETTAEGGVSLY